MPLLLVDLDNTLVDRAAAVRRWATSFVEALGGSPDQVDWIVGADGDGLPDRESVARSIAERFGLTYEAQTRLVGTLRAGLVEYMHLDPAVALALRRAREADWTTVAVTNGTVSQQTNKIRALGLDQHLDDWVISEGVGVKKPDLRIFVRAAEKAGRPLTDAWMVGDHPRADIHGGQSAGTSTCWLRRGRVWAEPAYQPTLEADECATALLTITGRG